MRKCMSMVIAIALVLCAISPCAAFAKERENSNYVHVLDADSVLDEFGVKGNDITYSNLSVRVSDTESYNCCMSFVLNVGPKSYDIVATGLLDEYELGTCDSLLHGCLRGTVEISGILYSVTVGLTKESDNDSINAGVVLMPNEGYWSDNVIIFGMGDYVMSADAEAALLGDDVYNIDESSLDEPYNMLANDETVGDVLTVKASIYDSIAQSIKVSVKPDMDAVRRYMYKHFSHTGDENGNGAGVSYSFDSIQVGVRKNSSYFNLTGIYTGHVENNNDYANFESMVWAVICDILGSYGAPTNTLAALFAKRTSDPTDNTSPNNYSITLSGKDLYDDVGTYGVAAEFATTPNTSLTPGSGYATAYGNATFKVVQIIPFSGNYSFYIDANEKTASVRVTVG